MYFYTFLFIFCIFLNIFKCIFKYVLYIFIFFCLFLYICIYFYWGIQCYDIGERLHTQAAQGWCFFIRLFDDVLFNAIFQSMIYCEMSFKSCAITVMAHVKLHCRKKIGDVLIVSEQVRIICRSLGIRIAQFGEH